jgi:hypothetical protein
MTSAKLPAFRVIFRADPDGGVFAILPDLTECNGHVGTYEHVGQHSAGNYLLMVGNSRAATPEEYAPLLAEMGRVYGPSPANGRGHAIRPVKRR